MYVKVKRHGGSDEYECRSITIIDVPPDSVAAKNKMLAVGRHLELSHAVAVMRETTENGQTSLDHEELGDETVTVTLEEGCEAYVMDSRKNTTKIIRTTERGGRK